jgi:hypothetical protein
MAARADAVPFLTHPVVVLATSNGCLTGDMSIDPDFAHQVQLCTN